MKDVSPVSGVWVVQGHPLTAFVTWLKTELGVHLYCVQVKGPSEWLLVFYHDTLEHHDVLLYRQVDRWVGQGGKSSLPDTTDADILEYILTKITTRIKAKVKTFLVKSKHTGENH